MSTLDVRPPPCPRCGRVEAARATRQHRCNPNQEFIRRHGMVVAERVARCVVAAFEAVRSSP